MAGAKAIGGVLHFHRRYRQPRVVSGVEKEVFLHGLAKQREQLAPVLQTPEEVRRAERDIPTDGKDGRMWVVHGGLAGAQGDEIQQASAVPGSMGGRSGVEWRM